jgi:transcriptional regulator with GAF, ATPase, and Fis domain
VIDRTLPGYGQPPALGTGGGSPWPVESPAGGVGAGTFGAVGIEPRDQPPPPSVVTIRPGMTMAEIERAAIESALRETRGNRRKAAELLGIGERTLYRKLREYQLVVDTSALD